MEDLGKKFPKFLNKEYSHAELWGGGREKGRRIAFKMPPNPLFFV